MLSALPIPIPALRLPLLALRVKRVNMPPPWGSPLAQSVLPVMVSYPEVLHALVAALADIPPHQERAL